jgi:hypothetical protein
MPHPPPPHPPPSPAPAVAEASARVERHVRAVAGSIPGAQLEIRFPLRVSPCTEPVGGGPPGQVTAGVAYRVTGLPAERNPAAFDTARRYWMGHGYRVVVDSRPRDAYLQAEAPAPDWTTISLQESTDGHRQLYLVANSACVLPGGTG